MNVVIRSVHELYLGSLYILLTPSSEEEVLSILPKMLKCISHSSRSEHEVTETESDGRSTNFSMAYDFPETYNFDDSDEGMKYLYLAQTVLCNADDSFCVNQSLHKKATISTRQPPC